MSARRLAVLAGLLWTGLALSAEGAQGAESSEAAAIAFDEDPELTCGGVGRPALATGPSTVSFGPVGFGTARRACPRSEIVVGGAGGAIIDTPDFYGALSASALVAGSLRLNDRWEAFLTWEAVAYQFAQNASLKGSSLGTGPLTLGAAWLWKQGSDWSLAPSARVMLPTTFPTMGAVIGGLSAGMAWQWRRKPMNAFHAYAGAELTSGLFRTPAQPRGGLFLTAGTELLPCRWASVVVDVQAHFAERSGLDYLAPVVELRAGGREWGVSLGAGVPLFGADRHDFVGQLRLSWLWDWAWYEPDDASP